MAASAGGAEYDANLDGVLDATEVKNMIVDAGDGDRPTSPRCLS